MRPGSSTDLHTVRLKQQPGVWQYMWLAAVIAVILLTTSSLQSQTKAPAPGAKKAAPGKSSASGQKKSAKKAEEPDYRWLQELLKDKELMAEAGKLSEKLRDGVHSPAARNRSNILPRLPESTLFYVALPNYGETMHQALQIFQQELRESAPLRDFLKKNKLDTVEPKIEDGIQKFYEFTQFLGDEVVVTGKMQGQEPSVMLVAEVKKPGLKEFLEKLNNEVFTGKNDRLRIVEPQELAAASDSSTAQAPLVLVRPDLVVMGFTAASLRELNAQIDQSGPRFISSPLGERVKQSYQGGMNSVLGVDLHKMIGLIPQPLVQDRLEKTGFADAKYVVAENTIVAGRSASQVEMAFNGPRHGIASWIAASAPMGGLDFVSSHAAMAGDVVLKNPAQIFDDVVELAGGAAALAAIPQMEAQLNMNLKQDLLSKLGGEIAFEVQAPTMMADGQAKGKSTTPQEPGKFKVILRVLDPAGLQKTLTRLLQEAPLQTGKREEDGVTFYTLTTPSPSATGQPTEINYFFMDGYLVVASDAATAAEAARAHRSGDSLGRSSKLRESLAPGQSANASIMFYQNAGQMLGPMLAQLPEELRELLPVAGPVDTKANVFYVYGDQSSFRGTTNNNVNADVSVALIVAAIAVPNLLRSRVAANEAAATSTLRVLNTSQVTYATVFPERGYAPNLAALGPPPSGDCSGPITVPAHACLLDDVLGNANCTAGKWCEKNGYRYSMRATCLQSKCKGYVVTATPINTGTGGKSFCSGTDAVVRVRLGTPLEAPLTAAECRAWAPIY